MAHLARKWEIEEGSGDYWWLGILRAFTGNSGSSDSAAGQPTVDPKNVRWM